MLYYFINISLLELGFYFAQILFFVARSHVNMVWYHVLGLVHPVRAIMGLYIVR